MRIVKITVLCVLLAVLTATGRSTAQTKIDELVGAKLARENISPSEICSDEIFQRRLYLVLTGRLPEHPEKFLDSTDPNKREKLVDELIGSKGYLDFQLLKWGDLFRIKSEFPSNLWPNGVQAYNRYVINHLAKNTPYNEFVKELLMSTGSNFRSPGVNFYRAFQTRSPQNIADNVALIFLGSRKAPTNSYRFFSQLKYKNTQEWKEEIVYLDIDVPLSMNRVTMPDGKVLYMKENSDYRKEYVDWLVESKQFSQAIVNRIWYWLMGTPIINEVDDIRPDNLPSNPQLLNYLTTELVQSGYNLRHIFRLILCSQTFARSSKPTADNGADNRHFSHYPISRLTAEQIIDAIGDITGINDTYMSKVPEPYSYFPADIHAAQVADGTVTSSSLEMFGRPSRDTSFESDRNNSLTDKQVLFLLNSAQITEKIMKSKKISALYKSNATPKQIITKSYLMVLSRYPNNKEISKLTSLLNFKNKKQATEDLIWALINSKEFLFNH